MKLDLNNLTIHQARDLLVRKEVSSLELTQAALERVHQVDSRLGAFITVTEGLALEQARRADRRLGQGEGEALTGIPMAVKDIICTKGIRTTCGSRMLENFVPPYDATVMAKLNAQGSVLIGKLNMDEFAMGSSTENSAFFISRNPWDPSRVPGGSSGGSAVAVASGEALFSLGSDTGGSVRLPAAFCNLVGLKPTYGLISRYGLVAFASSLDQIGPLTRDVADCALVTQVIAGYDPHDSTSLPQPVPDYSQSLIPHLKGIRLGVPREYFGQGLQPEVKTIIQAAIRELEGLGAEVDWEVSLPHTKYALAAYYILNPSEAMANLARYDGVKYGFSAPEAADIWQAMEQTRGLGFGPEVKRRIMLGTYALSTGYYDAYYLKAQKVRTLIRRELDALFDRFDALITPTSPTVPFKLGEKVGDPLQMYLSDVCAVSVNIAGIPALSVPAGFADGLPVGMQIIGKPLSEAILFRIGYAFQQATDWHKRTPHLEDCQ